MGLVNEVTAQGYEIQGAGSFLSGTGAPTGTAGVTDDAKIGSLWLRTDGSGKLYRKIADTSSAADWLEMDQGESPPVTTIITAATPTVASTCLVDDCNYVKYEIHLFETATPENKELFTVYASHNGHGGADATTVDFNKVHILNQGAEIPSIALDVVLSGAAGTQALDLTLSATPGITTSVRRTSVPA